MSILSEDAKFRIDEWLSGPYDDNTKKTIASLLANDPTALQNAFYTTLSFGTGGLRSIMGVGTNRLNIYTIRGATQGLANYLKKEGKKPLRVAIGYDCRHNSRLFAKETAQVLAANGIEALLTFELRPTPFVSFVCRHKECSAAVMITASHNPPEYNGYKVYWADGAQVVSPHAEKIIEEVNSIDNLAAIASTENPSLIKMLEPEDDNAYLQTISALQCCEKDNKAYGRDLNIVYTNLHGAGITLMEPALQSWGFSSVSAVDLQAKPDADFTTVESPNPENRKALELGEKILTQNNNDILIANDPDADRIACIVMHKSQPVMLNGNETAAILLNHLLENRNDLPKNSAIVSTIVTTRLLEEMAEKNNLAYFDVLTGFKYIGEKIHLWEETKEHTFLMGAEQSYGFLIGSYARDKDGIAIGCFLCEAALQAKRKDITLVDKLHTIYEEYGVFRENERNVHFGEGEEAKKKMDAFMDSLRKSPPKMIAEQKVISSFDYQHGIDDLPKTNAVAIYLENQAHLIIRPSGTEPKIKIYGFIKAEVKGSLEKTIQTCDAFINEALKFNALI